MMKNFIGIFCVLSAIWVVGSAALEAAQDQQTGPRPLGSVTGNAP